MTVGAALEFSSQALKKIVRAGVVGHIRPFLAGRTMGMVERVLATQKAIDLIARLKGAHGPLLFHQSGGCCDGSSPMCYPRSEFRTGAQDVLLGEIGGCPVYIGAAQYELWAHTQLIIDVVPGRGSGFSVESPEGVRFLTRGRVFTEAEREALAGELKPSSA
jgi:uncharacterized protein (DUF779 family)